VLLAPGILRRRLELLPPDVREERDGRVLLLWGNVPHWMVVDKEMDAFLLDLDGRSPLGDFIRTTGHSRRGLAGTAKDLLAIGVLHDPQSPKANPKPEREFKLENIGLNLTARCNLRCAFCYNRDRLAASPQGEITAEEICGFLDTAKPLTAKAASLVILGGEPFLEPRKLFTVLAHAKRLGLTSLVSTNGTLVTPELAGEARRNRLHVQVSIDGPDANSHDSVRGPGGFDRAVAGVRHLVAARVHTVISMVCHDRNIEQLEEFFDLAVRLRVDEARFIPLKRIGAADTSGFHPVPISKLMSTAYSLFKRRPEFLKFLGRDAFSVLGNTCRYSARRPSCGTGLQTVLLDADGALYPCLNLNLPQFRIASIRDRGYDLSKIWRKSAGLRALREDTSLDNPRRACSRCPVRYWCLGGCRGETLALCGDVRAPSPGCADLRRAMLDMMWVLAESPAMIRPAIKIC